MDQRPGLGDQARPTGDIGGAIDDPGLSQPSTNPFDEPEAGTPPGVIDTPRAGGQPGTITDPSGEDNIRDGNVGGVIGGPRQSQGQGQGG